MRRAFSGSILLMLVLGLFGGTTVLAVDPTRATRAVPEAVDDLRLDQPVTAHGVARPSVLDASLLSATGIRQVVVRLTQESVGGVAASDAGAAAQRAARGAVRSQQRQFLDTTDATVLAQTEVALNAVVLEVDTAELAALAANPAVTSISPVIDYERSLTETVPHVGASAVHTAGFTGEGVTVAVLDSGIDYTHAAFGGPGTSEAYDAAYGATTESADNKDDPTWPAPGTNIVGGRDFVGESWPDGPLAQDGDPIDCGGKTIGAGPDLCEGGHGTHVADIIGGVNGVAPDADLHAVKVCSAVTTSCSGVALLLGMDYALDPNGDGVTDDHVDVINMSLGSPYGQARDDALSAAVETATEVGVLTVASAGNSSDKPYVTGSPGAAPSALSVAQTAVPSARLPLLQINAPDPSAGLYPAVFQPWSEPLETDGAILNAVLQHGDGAGGNEDGCLPFAAGTLTGLVVLVDRGGCDFSVKISNIAAGGADAGLIGLIDTSEPFEGGLGNCPLDLCSSIPGFMIHQSTSNLLKAGIAGGLTVSLDPASGLPLIGTMVGSSSRGPTMLTNVIKPEIGAPGASISAEAGTATGTTPFGGTSGAAPMVTGSAALLLDAYSDRSPAEIKSLLMNYAETEIYNGAPDAPINAGLAAIQRIGGGEVRVDRSLDGADHAAWDSEALTGALSFGFVDVADATVLLTREVTVSNYGASEETFAISPSFRFMNDETNGAVDVSAPADVVVPAGGTATFDVTLTIDGDALREWTANSGGNGANAAAFTTLEYDGYLELTPTVGEPLHLAWHVLPRQSGEATAVDDTVTIDGEFEGLPAGTTTLTNAGVGIAGIDGYSLIGESPSLPAGPEGVGLPTIDLRYAGVQTIPVPAGFCDDLSPSFVLAFASSTYERQTHANAPAAFEWDIDTDGDGTDDYAVYNLDLAGTTLSDGRNAVYVADLDASTASIGFLTDHGTNSGNTVQYVCAEQLGLTEADYFTPLTADLYAVDIYFSGRVTDQILGMEFAPLGERYFPVVGDDGFGSGDVPAAGSETLTVMDFGAVGTNPSELGVLLFADGARSGFRAGAPQTHETIVLRVEQGDVAPPPPPPDDELPFDDIEDSAFVNDIVWAYENGITGGCSTDPPLYCPDSNVTREQMATFLDRMLDLGPTSTDFFGDDDGSIHEGAINRLAAAGITGGCGPGTFCPKARVLRDQMASFLVRAFDIAPSAVDPFTDDEGNIHENDINAVAAAGVTAGCGPARYCPKNPVTRGQMAAFLHRVAKE